MASRPLASSVLLPGGRQKRIVISILTASSRIERRFEDISKPDDFLVSEKGVDKLDAMYDADCYR